MVVYRVDGARPQRPICGTFGGIDVQVQCQLVHPTCKPAPTSKYPVVLFLHGRAERGDDNSVQLKHVALFMQNAPEPCFILAPQCPIGMRWVEERWTQQRHTMHKEPSPPLALAMRALELLLQNEQHADATRTYVVGLSMGGFGVWEAITRWPERFAGALPVCGGADEKALVRIAKSRSAEMRPPPVWAFHSKRDHIVPPIRSRRPVRKLRHAGIHKRRAKLTQCTTVGHGCWGVAFRQARQWLFSFQRIPSTIRRECFLKGKRTQSIRYVKRASCRTV